MVSDPHIIQQTSTWIRQVVIKNNFCPFAAKEMNRDRIHYLVCKYTNPGECLEQLNLEFQRLDEDQNIATSLLIFPHYFSDFFQYLDFLEQGQKLLKDKRYEGIYQLASFHPNYCFADAPEDDPANYTNRSPYPMVHLLREDSLEKALASYLHPEKIPQNNIDLARKKGLEEMHRERMGCFHLKESDN